MDSPPPTNSAATSISINSLLQEAVSELETSQVASELSQAASELSKATSALSEVASEAETPQEGDIEVSRESLKGKIVSTGEQDEVADDKKSEASLSDKNTQRRLRGFTLRGCRPRSTTFVTSESQASTIR